MTGASDNVPYRVTQLESDVTDLKNQCRDISTQMRGIEIDRARAEERYKSVIEKISHVEKSIDSAKNQTNDEIKRVRGWILTGGGTLLITVVGAIVTQYINGGGP